ncbi:hypothetical protein C8T65DRAFT_204334 [Cerioporus squamosus]|nr:hypothetical protein C8T65DRAFT_204334 [Cerioporus squamosus]
MASTSSSSGTSSAPAPSAPAQAAQSATSTPHRSREPDQESFGADDDGLEAPRRKRARKTKDPNEVSYTATGAAVGLMGDLFRDFQAILDYGLQLLPDTPESPPTSRDRKYLALFQHIVSLSPKVVDDILKRGVKGSYQVARELEAGRSGTRGVDIHNIKKAILTWDTYDPPILPEAKSVRGFNHPLCGRLLCPPSYDWSDPEVRRAIQNQSRKYPVGAQNFPRVLWLNEEMNRDNPAEGFARNRRLILAGRFCLLGPMASTATGASKTPTRKPKAKIHRVRSISPAFIAYTALLVHLSLNSQESFNDGSTPGTYPYESFYQNITGYIEKTMTVKERSDLLVWWTTQMFGALEDDFSDNEEDPEHLSLLGFMKKQAAARATAQEAQEGPEAAA